MSRSLPDPVADAVTGLVERVADGEAPDGTVSRQLRVCSSRPAATRAELRRIAALLGESPDGAADGDGPTTPTAAGRLLYGLVTANFEAVVDTAPEATWAALNAAAVTANDAGPAGRYPRLLLREFLVGPDEFRPDADFDRLDRLLADPQTRRTGAAVCAANKYAQECLDGLGDCLTAPDTWTRRFAAKALDYHHSYDSREGTHGSPSPFDPTPIADALLSAARDDDPRVRGHAVAALCRAIGRYTDAAWAPAAVEALSDALVDDDEFVSARATRVLSTTKTPVTTTDTELADAISPETRGQLLVEMVRSVGTVVPTDRHHDERVQWMVDEVPTGAIFQVEDELRALGWGADAASDEWLTRGWLAQRALARAAEADAEALAEPAWYVAQYRTGDTEAVTEQEARILRALAPVAPDTVAEAVPELESLVASGEQSDVTRDAAVTLARLDELRPDTVSVAQSTLVDACGGVRDGRRFDVDAVCSLVEIDEQVAVAGVREACRQIHDRDDLRSASHSDLAEIVAWYADEHPAVVRETLDDIVGVFDVFETTEFGRLLAALNAATADHRELLVPHADAVFEQVTDLRADARAEAAGLLRALGQAQSDAIPVQAEPLLDPAADPDSSAWPLGTLAAADPEFARTAIREAVERVAENTSPLFEPGRKAAHLLLEAYEGDTELAIEETRRVLDTDGAQPIRARVVKSQPDIAVAVADRAVEVVAAADSPNLLRHHVRVPLEAAVESEPEAVRDAILAHYDDAEAFIFDCDRDEDHSWERQFRWIARDAGLDVSERP